MNSIISAFLLKCPRVFRGIRAVMVQLSSSFCPTSSTKIVFLLMFQGQKEFVQLILLNKDLFVNQVFLWTFLAVIFKFCISHHGTVEYVCKT